MPIGMNGFQKGHPNYHLGDSLVTREKKRRYSIDNREDMRNRGKKGAENRWKDHISIPRIKPMKKYGKYSIEKKRFTNMRYKARKRNAQGSHTLDEWLLLKNYYKNMCLCCKQQEPDIKVTEDHIIPLSMGGSDDIANIQPLCVACNTRKHAKTISYLPFRNIYDPREGIPKLGRKECERNWLN